MLDTNVLISLGLFPSSSMQKLKEVLARDQVVFCDYVLEEAVEVFRRKFPTKMAALVAVLDRLPYERVPTSQSILSLPMIRDADDAPVLASAIAADVDILVTGDRDFEGLGLARPMIMTPAEYVTKRDLLRRNLVG